MSKYVYGFDFGTSNSALSILDVESGKIVKTFNEASLLYFSALDSSDIYIGKQALEKYLEYGMRGRFIKSVKTMLPQKDFHHTLIHHTMYKPEELVALIIKHLKRKADAYLNEEVDSAIFGRPVIFDDQGEKEQIAEIRLLEAAKSSGFNTIQLQYEPIAAAFAYERELKQAEKVLVADFGAGTSDFTVMTLDPARATASKRDQDMLAKGGIHIAGDDFDSKVMWEKLVRYFGYLLEYDSGDKKLMMPHHFYTKLCHWERLNYFKSPKLRRSLDGYYRASGKHPALKRMITLVDNDLGYPILRAIEQAKVALSDAESTEIKYAYDCIDINHPLSLSDFDNIIAPDVQAIESYLLNFLKEASIAAEDIQSVFITGGSSLVKSVRNIFATHFGEDKIRSGNSFNSVAQGLAYSYYGMNEGE
jgi:hypothetical chaperone protein